MVGRRKRRCTPHDWMVPRVKSTVHPLHGYQNDRRDQCFSGRLDPTVRARVIGWTYSEEYNMQRQFTIELRVDFADPEKLEPVKKVLLQAARHAFATAQLISDNQKSTRIAIWSDDFFSGHEEISLLKDEIQDGVEVIGPGHEDTGISAELLAAAKP